MMIARYLSTESNSGGRGWGGLEGDGIENSETPLVQKNPVHPNIKILIVNYPNFWTEFIV